MWIAGPGDTAVALDAAGHLISQRRFAVEGANGLGRGIAQQLSAAGERVFDAPATLAVRARLLNTGGGRKSDPADALSVAQVTLYQHDLHVVTCEDQNTIFAAAVERRDDLAHERTRVLNRLHGLHARDLLADLRRVDQRLKDNEAQSGDALAAAGSTLTEIHGVGDVTRFRTSDRFASYTGSGEHQAGDHAVTSDPPPGGCKRLNDGRIARRVGLGEPATGLDPDKVWVHATPEEMATETLVRQDDLNAPPPGPRPRRPRSQVFMPEIVRKIGTARRLSARRPDRRRSPPPPLPSAAATSATAVRQTAPAAYFLVTDLTRDPERAAVPHHGLRRRRSSELCGAFHQRTDTSSDVIRTE